MCSGEGECEGPLSGYCKERGKNKNKGFRSVVALVEFVSRLFEN